MVLKLLIDETLELCDRRNQLGTKVTPLLKGEAWKLTREIDMGGEKRAGNYLAKGKVKIEGYFERLYH